MSQDGQEKLVAIFREAVKSLSEELRPGESQRAAKKRRHHAALTIELLRKKLLSALDEIEKSASPDSATVSVDLSDVDKSPSPPKKRKPRRKRKTKEEWAKEKSLVVRRWVDLI
jgi:hypothetical protein